MAEAASSSLPLLARRSDKPLFRTPGGEVTAAMFLDAAFQLAASLPSTSHVVNLCRDRLAFAKGFAATLLNGQVSLLTSDRSPGALGKLPTIYPDLASFSEDQPQMNAIPHQRIGWDGSGAGEARVEARIPTDRLAAIVFTSGTTGEPAGHRKLWGALACRSRDAAERFGFSSERPASIVATVPPQHMYGFETTILLPLTAPVSVWCGPAFYPRDIETALAACPEPRILVTTPLQIRALLATKADLPPLARIISATAALDAAMATMAESLWNTEVHEIFGATEIGSIASRRTTAGSVWTMYPHVRLAPDPDREHPLINAPYAAPFPLGDRVQWLDSAHFRLLGRRTDIVKLGGRRASLAALNRILTSIAGVEDGVFVVPNDLERQPTARLSAFVVAPGCSTEEIRAALRGQIDPLFLPRRIVRVGHLPRNAVGKLTREALAVLETGAGGC